MLTFNWYLLARESGEPLKMGKRKTAAMAGETITHGSRGERGSKASALPGFADVHRELVVIQGNRLRMHCLECWCDGCKEQRMAQEIERAELLERVKMAVRTLVSDSEIILYGSRAKV